MTAENKPGQWAPAEGAEGIAQVFVEPIKKARMLGPNEFSFGPMAARQEYIAVNRLFLVPIIERDIIPSENINLIDIACAQGGNTKLLRDFLAEYGKKGTIIGADIDGEAITEGKAKVGSTDNIKVDFIRADARRLPFLSNKFTAAFFLNALHEIPGQDNKMDALKEAARISDKLYVLSAFTASMFPDRHEFGVWGDLRKNCFTRLGKQRDKSRPRFEVHSIEEYCEMMNKSGWRIDPVDNVRKETFDIDSEVLKDFSNDKPFLHGFYQDMEDTDEISFDSKRQVIWDEVEAMEEARRLETGDPSARVIFRRTWVLFEAEKAA